MRALQLAGRGDRLSVLCLGAHSDDIEIGAGGTLLTLLDQGVRLDVHWCVLSGNGERGVEATASANDFLAEAAGRNLEILNFRDGFFPEQGEEIKAWFESLKSRINPDVILAHRRDDAHQDHRQVNRLVWNTFRDHLVLEYEIPKWDGDLGRPNVYMPVSEFVMKRKVALLMSHFGSQRSKQWFDPETFLGLARLRGMECRAPERYAEAFVVRKLSLG
ncbi:GlcNAc-PI de-N-acetylase [Bradyrhizobium sp. SSBR45G]|uniref:PIG-L deacetylase family protein n=1 Tax=unclassified Bradyrhizobium TaxID=2631580 RepID=UPI002342AB7F|nr:MULTISPECIES: PIG-L deacetylase family protein [unclassified Bradyrhizobium]GLH79941.1 GlcNAc-PI de-N-acetylase [Bradyrhizobium sp. SSBR45G]GLH87317.1 GlcNAc-PI de-N-acetylase [Bradyrhizobium sp. SSBR45R]